MITVHVWPPHGENVGHASMHIGNRAYVSWWPDEAAKTGNFHPSRDKITGELEGSGRRGGPRRLSFKRAYESDVRDEGGQPIDVIIDRGLDEAAMLRWWEAFGMVRNGQPLVGPMLPYNLLRQNCSTVVARALKAGGGDSYASWYSSWSVIWRPKTVLQYALSIKKGLGGK